jgi:hypothetical protein
MLLLLLMLLLNHSGIPSVVAIEPLHSTEGNCF